MKFAYLILAHRNPRQLYRLIQTLGITDNTFIIHVDGNNLASFIRLFGEYNGEKIIFVPSRTETFKGSINTVEIIMSLIKYLFKCKIDFDYAHLIGGGDYSLMNSNEIFDFFSTNNGKNYIECTPLSDSDWPQIGFERVNYKWFVNSKCIFNYSDLEYKRSNNSWETSTDCKLYGGSQWWSLHYNCIKYLNDECNEKNNIYRFFRYSFMPEEMLFHTLLMNSPFKNSIINENLRLLARPEILSTESLHALKIAQKIFIHKINSINEGEILNDIDRFVGGNKYNQINSFSILKKQPKCCVISAVGKNSLHHTWIKGKPDFDLHLIVYDDSFDEFKQDSPYITQDKGFKFKLLYRYLNKNKHLLEQYDYFYLPDDDIDIDTENINKLFKYMEEYRLEIAQPAICNSYFTFVETTKNPNTILRFSNFVEVMQPCFSKEALIKVLFTFNENQSGWGIDYHWGKLVDHKNFNMAIIDDVVSIHTRPVASKHSDDLNNYIRLYNLNPEIIIFGKISNLDY